MSPTSIQNVAQTPALRLNAAPGNADDAAWGSNFWVTLVDPQVRRQSSVRRAELT